MAAFRYEVLLIIIFSFFIFFFTLEKSLNIYGLLESFPAYFKKALINPVYLYLNITV